MPRWWKALGVALLVLALAFAGILFIALSAKPAVQAAPMPNPNGYDDFLQAARWVVTTPAVDVTTLPIEQHRALIRQNAKALELVRSGLEKKSRVPVRSTSDPNGWVGNVTTLKGLALALRDEGILAEREGRTNDAWRSYVDCLRFGQKSSYGGLIIDDLVAIAGTGSALERLRLLFNDLDAANTRWLLEALAEIDRTAEPAETIIQRDKQWGRRVHGPFRFLWISLATRKSLAASHETFRQRHDRAAADLHLLRVEVALRLFRLGHGKLPRTLDELIPNYLDSNPVDSSSGKPFLYEWRTNSYRLYSVGPDGKR